MKNLKKVLALVVVFSMMLCSVAFASFPDVAEDADYAVAVNTLAALGIVGGDDQGNFNPDNTITRAEFTKIVCEIQGLKGDANKGATAFTDVPADHWASGYINMATNLKIINGMGDGTFAPESPVTYEQAIKMLVVTLGFAPMAEDRGGYPTGHLVVAQQYGMTKGISAPAQTDAAKRALIAQVVYNTIDTPMMEQTGFGSNITYEVKDGNNDRERVTLLTSKFDVVKLGGVVVANEKVSINENASPSEGEIALVYDNNYKSTNEEFELSGRGDAALLNNIEIGETDADDLFGLRVIAYVRDNGKGYELIAAVAEEGKNSSKEIVLSDIDTGSRTEIEEEGKLAIAYFESASASRSTKLSIADEYVVIWNSVNNDNTLADIIDAVEDGDVSAKLELVDWDGDNKYDFIKVNQFFHYVVEEIDADIYELTTLDGSSIDLDEENEYTIEIKDAKGDAVAFEDIKEGDVIAVVSDNVDDAASPEDFIEITVLGQTAIEGAVRTFNGNAAIPTAKIADSVYNIDPACYNADKIGVGSEGLFYLGVDGQIVAFDGSKAAAGNYGIIVETEEVEGWSAGFQVRILDSEGKAIIYDIADKLKVKGYEKIVENEGEDNERVIYEPVTVTFEEGDTIPEDFFKGTAFEGMDNVTREKFLEEFDEEPANDAEKVQRLVQFKVNSSDEVTEIAPASDDTFEVTDIEEDSEYTARSKKFAGLGKIDDSTVIFAINNNDIAKTKISNASALLDEAEYTVVGVGEEDGIFAALMILDGGSTLAGTVDGWAVVTAVSETKDADDNDAYEISFVENGEKEVKTILVNGDTEVDDTYNSDDAMTLAEAMSVGSIFLYAADAEGMATTIASIANVVEDGDYEVYAPVIDIDETYGTGSKATKFVYGVQKGKVTNDLALVGVSEDIYVDGSSHKYTYNNTNARNKTIEVGTIKGGDVKTADDGEANLFFIRMVDDEVVDIIAVGARVPDDILAE